MWKILLVEDEDVAAVALQDALDRYALEHGEQFAVARMRSALELDEQTSGFDLIFMDIELLGGNGMDAALELRQHDQSTPLIFVTSLAQYAVGKKMTNFTLTDTDGNAYKLYDLLKEKQLVVLDFWYTTCEPCKSEFPFFEAVANKYSSKMQLLAVDPIDSVSAITRLRQELNVTFPMMKDTCNLYLGFGVYTYPTTIFIDSNGIIMDIHIGAYESEMAFLAAVERYIQ